MSFVTLINCPVVTCATNTIVLTTEQVHEITTLRNLTAEIKSARDHEIQNIQKSKIKGFEQGYKEGIEQACSQIRKEFENYMERAIESLVETQTVTNDTVVDLAMQIVRKITVDIGPEDMLVGIARNVLNNFKIGENVKLKVNTIHAENIKNKLSELMRRNGQNLLQLEVVGDATVGELDCIIATESGETNASFNQQIELVKAKLKQEIKSY